MKNNKFRCDFKCRLSRVRNAIEYFFRYILTKPSRCIKNWGFCKKYPFWKMSDAWYMHNTSIKDERIGKKDFFTLYDYTWYDDIPSGWQKAFGKNLSKELLEVGNKYLKINKDKQWSDILQFVQIKEKYGSLRLYANAIKEIEKILKKYELMSIGYCMYCGKHATYKTEGYISYVCEDCFKSFDEYKNLDKKHRDFYRLKEEDIPKPTTFSDEKTPSINETFKTKKEAKKRWNEILNEDDDNENIHFELKKVNNKWNLTGTKKVEHEINLKKEYGVDYYTLWGIDKDQNTLKEEEKYLKGYKEEKNDKNTI